MCQTQWNAVLLSQESGDRKSLKAPRRSCKDMLPLMLGQVGSLLRTPLVENQLVTGSQVLTHSKMIYYESPAPLPSSPLGHLSALGHLLDPISSVSSASPVSSPYASSRRSRKDLRASQVDGDNLLLNYFNSIHLQLLFFRFLASYIFRRSVSHGVLFFFFCTWLGRVGQTCNPYTKPGSDRSRYLNGTFSRARTLDFRLAFFRV